MDTALLYQLALTRIPMIGPALARELLAHFHGNPEAIFKARKTDLERIPGIGPLRAQAIRDFQGFQDIEKEIRLLERHHIHTCFITDPQYPPLLKDCPDAPIVLYFRGQIACHDRRVLSVVGTRHQTPYGREVCAQLIQDLKAYDPIIVSGLALGIDITAHRAALEQDMVTLAVLAHGLDRIYPPQHQTTARQMLEHGGWISEFPPGTQPEREHFPRRNRIIAGISEGTLIVETGVSGGSMITAHLAAGYQRVVMAVPGRLTDLRSAGCLSLIRNQVAIPITSAEDIAQELGWKQPPTSAPAKPPSLFREWSPAEQAIVDLFNEKNPRHVEEIYLYSGLPSTEAAAVLLQLELEGFLRTIPGKMYEWVQ
ncbi:MAG: DNA-protecting protein DprA [Thermoflavifilum sp.]|nr:DNA-protecting protein DprA [Thermoflavifilum sp.]